ncbi:hypothetical protein B0H15DRAFT_860150 [Mycena belliarum]|uniref:Uncharacterized protein n=1 Tax=Mycena belliarum TaxID=1033014 RepID=A0AAD6XJA1_9AGAR|nr:hypothetical protein B0H15DRAFT_860124 [Mycena belliae]KAJ7078575.1 hypothetical protein B0H15DRAFT_860150 [Mycena belliae]
MSLIYYRDPSINSTCLHEVLFSLNPTLYRSVTSLAGCRCTVDPKQASSLGHSIRSTRCKQSNHIVSVYTSQSSCCNLSYSILHRPPSDASQSAERRLSLVRPSSRSPHASTQSRPIQTGEPTLHASAAPTLRRSEAPRARLSCTTSRAFAPREAAAHRSQPPVPPRTERRPKRARSGSPQARLRRACSGCRLTIPPRPPCARSPALEHGRLKKRGCGASCGLPGAGAAKREQRSRRLALACFRTRRSGSVRTRGMRRAQAREDRAGRRRSASTDS